MKCAINGCANSVPKNPEKYFFFSPNPSVKRTLWIEAMGKSYSPKSNFRICEDHFDMRNDVDAYRVNGAPVLKKLVVPHRNFTPSDMELQAQIDKINFSCFAPSCENKRLMADRKVVFFPVPEGSLGQLWRSAVMDSHSNDSSDELQFCCEEHFDITMDLNKKFHCNGTVEYTVKDDILPSLSLSDSKLLIRNELSRLSDMHTHPRTILNNHLSYLYANNFPLIIEKLQMKDAISFVDIKDIKTEPIDSYEAPDIKTEPMDYGYDCEFNTELVMKREPPHVDNNPLDSEPECEPESELESESSDASSVTKKQSDDDPDITTDDFSSTDDDDDSISSGDLDEVSDCSENDKDSDIDTAERFECSHCKRFVKHLDQHVERSHWNFSKNVNRTICGLCLETFSRRVELKNHQIKVHDGNAYACDICGMQTGKHWAMQKHIIRLHSYENLFLCQHCGAGFKFTVDLHRHVRKFHSGVRQRNHACHLCDKRFFDATTLRTHISSVHSNLRPHHCQVDGCSKTFKRKTHLRTHQQVHTSNNLYSCIICQKQFTFKFNLVTHIKNVHKT